MIRVLVEQQVIPPYRIPFFDKLAKRIDLLVLASDRASVSGVGDVIGGVPFPSVRSRELTYHGHHAYHQDIVRILREHAIDVYVSNWNYLTTYAVYSRLYRELLSTGVRIIYWGCDGYANRNLDAVKRINALGYKLVHPKAWPHVQNDPNAFALKIADGFVAYSNFTARYWQHVWGVPTTRISVAHNAIDTAPLLNRYRELLSAGRPRVEGRIVFAGRMTTDKGLDLLLRAYGKVKKAFPVASLTLVGDGPVRVPLERTVDGWQLKDVEFLGEIRDQIKLADVMCRASLFILPGLGGLAVNTAMACGLPIICSDADGTELDLVREGVNGWFFSPGDDDDLTRVMGYGLSSPELLYKYGKESVRLIENVYNLDNMVSAFVKRIECVLQ